MVRLAESKYVVHRNRYYLWSYIPKEYCSKSYNKVTPSGKFLYRKHICGIPYYTRLHAKKMITILLGVDALLEIRVVSGRRLYRQGLRTFPKKYIDRVFFKGKPRKVRKWVTPPDYLLTKHRRRYFRVFMYRQIKHGKKKFNQELIRKYYGYRLGFSPRYLQSNRYKVYKLILPEVCKSLGIREEDIVFYRHGKVVDYRGSNYTPVKKKEMDDKKINKEGN